MGGIYICWANDNNLVDREVCISLHKLVIDNCSYNSDPYIISVGLTEILKLMSWM
jgi:hypothetical protein